MYAITDEECDYVELFQTAAHGSLSISDPPGASDCAELRIQKRRQSTNSER